VSFLIFSKPMLEETNWIYKLDLHIDLWFTYELCGWYVHYVVGFSE
jgi:hypothetical protein